MQYEGEEDMLVYSIFPKDNANYEDCPIGLLLLTTFEVLMEVNRLCWSNNYKPK